MKARERRTPRRERKSNTLLWAVLAIIMLLLILWFQKWAANRSQAVPQPTTLQDVGPSPFNRQLFDTWIAGTGLQEAEADQVYYTIESALDGRLLSEARQFILGRSLREAVTAKSDAQATDAIALLADGLRQEGLSPDDLDRVRHTLTVLLAPGALVQG